MTQDILNARQSEILISTWESIGAEVDLEKILSIVTHAAKLITQADHASMALVEGAKLCFVFSSNDETNQLNRLRINIGSGIPGKVARDGLARRIKNWQYDSPVSSQGSKPKNITQSRSMLCVPMLYQNQPIGTIQVFNKIGVEQFTADDESALQKLANRAAVEVERLRLNERAVKESRRIHGIFEALTDGIMVVDMLGNPIIYNKAVEELFFPDGKQNFALTTYLSNAISTDSSSGNAEVVLFKPHNLILSNRYVTLSDAAGKPSEIVVSIRNISDQRAIDRRYSQFYAFILHKAGKIVARALKSKNQQTRNAILSKQKDLIRNLLFLTSLKSGPLRIEKENCNIVDLYLRSKQKAVPGMQKKGIILEDNSIADFPPQACRIDATRIGQVFKTLFRKACRLLSEADKMRVIFNLNAGNFNFEVIYIGKQVMECINEESLDWNKSVDKINSGESSSLDLDLAMVGHVINAHKGHIDIKSEGDDTSKIYFQIPME